MVKNRCAYMDTANNNTWLCRHCNSLVDGDLKSCPHCHADRPEEGVSEPQPEGITEVVQCENYTNAEPKPKAKYIFREAVLANAADIILVLGLFATFGALIAPLIVDIGVDAPMMWAVCIAVVIFALTMITWAWLKSVAEISRMLRNKTRV